MGYYINHPSMSKEMWLNVNGIPVPAKERDFIDPKTGLVLVCLVSNFAFTAAAIIYSPGEYREFSDPSDDRPKSWYLVEVSKLKEIDGISLPF